MRRRLLITAAVLAFAAVLVPVASGFFFRAVDQPVTLEMAKPDRFVLATADAGGYTLQATDQLPGGAPVAIALEPSDGFDAVLLDADGIETITELTEPGDGTETHRGRVEVTPTDNAPGEHAETLTVHLTFGDGSIMRHVLPVTWTGP